MSETSDNRLTLIDGRSIGWAEYGDPAGWPVFFFHGWPGSRFQGARLDVAAWIVGARVISPDRPGYGLSTFQPGRSILDWPDDVAELADALGVGNFSVFGASGGGPYALACASRIPERLEGVAVSSGVGPPDAPGVADVTAPWRRAVVAGAVSARVPLVVGLRLAAGRALANPEGFLDWAARALPSCDRAIIGDPEFRAIAVQDITTALADGGGAAAWDARLLTSPWGFELTEIGAEVNLWYGGMDPIIEPIAGRHLARAIPGARARYLPNEGHHLMATHAIEILRAITPVMTSGSF